MSQWFRFISELETDDNLVNTLVHSNSDRTEAFRQLEQQLKQDYTKFVMINLGPLPEEFIKPIEKLASILASEYCALKQARSFDGQFSMCAFLDNVKTSLFKLWEEEIIQKSS